ncbi:hypothetical protein GCM10007886_38390 [Methylobacterium gregans]|uniref:O-antigen ligase-related domain-containing protein n=1 Tax=Methylobacterium gregans TaxID=374424 RepID=A0AA37HSV9_9HYPH|nr:O-antigen ligase family protein [Methylobacterium gregans]MDQ0522759.1 O-antigen ligase [Methylobacterium gregans]GJD81492.1 hypothetical protein NBEOAGPD_4741 [Methylobacterium gregans]GLS55654.1 hypothetical protein GCM10007886_38390 [Methylobacterium gregans]
MHATTLAGPDRPRNVGASRLGSLPVRTALEWLGYGLFWLFLFFTCFTFLRPSPYDFVAIPTLLLWSLLGLRFHRAAIAIFALLLLYGTCLVISLLPYLDETLPGEWTFQSVYLIVTGVFFVMFFSDQTTRRVEFALGAYLASCLFAAVCGILSYFDVLGDGVLFKMDGRASGVFEDPNLLGSFLILAALYLIHNLITGRTRRILASLVALLVILACIFLSFSRGSWAACVLGIGLMTAMAWVTAPTRALRRRIAGLGAVALVCGGAMIAGLFAVDGVAARFSDRAVATKDYDEGETGRFGNQRRGMEMLLERPEGFGPLRWRRIFNLEPHNSYIGAFSNGGWLAGFSFLGIVLATAFVGFRLCLTPSPYQRLAQIAWPALLMFFLQGFQIDIEKWRHVYMMLGMVWGLHVAREIWLRARDGRQAANA